MASWLVAVAVLEGPIVNSGEFGGRSRRDELRSCDMWERGRDGGWMAMSMLARLPDEELLL